MINKESVPIMKAHEMDKFNKSSKQGISYTKKENEIKPPFQQKSFSKPKKVKSAKRVNSCTNPHCFNHVSKNHFNNRKNLRSHPKNGYSSNHFQTRYKQSSRFPKPKNDHFQRRKSFHPTRKEFHKYQSRNNFHYSNHLSQSAYAYNHQSHYGKYKRPRWVD